MLLLFGLVGLVSLVAGSEVDLEGEMRLRLEHSLDLGRTWKPRGLVSLTRSRSGNPTIQQDVLSSDDYEKIKELCSNNELYMIKVIGEVDPVELQSFVSACPLVESGMAETLVVHVDWRGSVVAVNQGTRLEEAIYKGRNRERFDTKIVVQNMENGPTPDTAAFIQKVEEEKARKMTGETTENKSFFSKYWMYIVPVGIFMLINSAAGT